MLRHTRTVQRARPVTVCCLATLLLSGLAACGTSHDNSSPSTTTLPPVTTAAPTTTQPASDSPEMPDIINALLRQWDTGWNAILATPDAYLANTAAEAWRPMQQAFTSDSPYIEGLPVLVRGFTDKHLYNRPGPSGQGQRSGVVYTTDEPSPDTIRFVWCSFDDSVSFDTRTDAPVNDEVLSTSGWGEAHRTADGWRLYRLRALGQKNSPAGTPNDCPAV